VKPVPGWKAGLVIIGTIVLLGVIVNVIGLRSVPQPKVRQPLPAITGTPATPHPGPANPAGGIG
jgi:hypothetical protein